MIKIDEVSVLIWWEWSQFKVIAMETNVNWFKNLNVKDR